MGSTVTSKADGSFVIELISPIGPNGNIKEVTIAPFELDHPIRWASGDFPSLLSLMAEVTGLSETVLRTLRYPDADRVMIMFGLAAPATIKADMEAGKRPMATPRPRVMPSEEQPAHDESEPLKPDPVDPRFPYVKGPVQRIGEAAASDDDGGGMSTAPAGRIERVR